MGTCAGCFKERSHYKIEEAQPTLKAEFITLPTDEHIASLLATDNKWFVAQENLISEYCDFEKLRTWSVDERVRCMILHDSWLLHGGKDIVGTSLVDAPSLLLSGHQRVVTSLASFDDFLVSGSSDWTLRLWDLSRNQELARNTLSWNVVTALKRVPETKLFAQTSEDLTLRLWNVDQGNFELTKAINIGPNLATCCDIKGNCLVTGHRGFDANSSQIKVFDLRKLEDPIAIKEHEQGVQQVVFIGEELFTCGKDGRLCVFDTQTWRLMDEWHSTHQLERIVPFKQGLLVASNEPKVQPFTISPLKPIVIPHF